MAGKFPDQVLPTQIHYVDGRPQSLSLRRLKLLIREGDEERAHGNSTTRLTAVCVFRLARMK